LHQLFRTGAAADDRRGLADEDRQSGPGKDDGGGKAVRTGADDNGVVLDRVPLCADVPPSI
jgi:hypothetical protein